ncbi:hypothetical protein A2311_02915 [candidate division WOR-1 bacterium RIFOXYB2_FULL_48_7]|uniref:Cell shape determination protein CcmA n=1 Tax=candidate division WOR-1 bacterium RIFOXYB2_FULL_48_7 TaxID=1802583 RepID=A0A1F4TWA5_UNCSA|nr:MAG: hypothetical protein A2311_02915 [candidate division WOR-1 bacterium RIFOXYB2_FULL_48_7]
MGLFDAFAHNPNRPVLLGGVESIIGENARFKGELHSQSSISINGEYEGKVSAEGDVIISQTGKVTGEIVGGNVFISGRVDGNIQAKQTLELAKSGRVHGDLSGGKIVIEEGSTYQGRVSVNAEQPSTPEF